MRTKVRPELVLQLGHSHDVTSVCFSSDGRYVLSGSGDQSIKLWDAFSGKLIRTFKGHFWWVSSISFSPNGKEVLSGSWDQTIKLWDTSTGKLIRSFEGHSGSVTAVCFSPDGRYVLSGSSDHTIKLWDASSGKLIRTFKSHSFWVTSVCFSPDGNEVLSGSSDHTLKLLDTSTGMLIRTYEGHSGGVPSACFSPDGKEVLSGSQDQTIKLWDTSTGMLIRSFEGHSGSVTAVCFSPDGRYVLSGSSDHTIKLWDASSGKLIRTFKSHSFWVTSVCFSPDGKEVLSGSWDHTLKLLDTSTGMLIRTYEGHSGGVPSACFSPDGKEVLSGSWDQTVKLWDTSQGKLIRTFEGHTECVYSVCFHPDGRFVLSGSLDQTIKLWDPSTGKLIRTFEGHSGGVTSVCFSPDGRFVLSGSGDQTIKCWDVSTGKLIRTFEGHSGGISSVSFSLDRKKVLSGSRDRTIKLWDTSSGRLIRTFEGHSDCVISICFSPDGKEILSGSEDQTIKLWDALSGKLIRTFKGHSWYVSSVCFSPNGKDVLSGSWDQTIKLWNKSTGKLIRTFKGHSWYVSSVCFSPNGKEVLSGSWDQTIKLWDTSKGKELLTLILFDENDWAVRTPQGFFDASERTQNKIHFVFGMEPVLLDQISKSYRFEGLWKIVMNNKDFLFPPVPDFKSLTLYPELQASIIEDELSISLVERGGGIGRVELYIENMRKEKDLRNDPVRDLKRKKLTINVDLKKYQRFFRPGKENNLFVYVYNKEGLVRSRPVHLVYTPAGVRGKAFFPIEEVLPEIAKSKHINPYDPWLHAIIIGADTYGLSCANHDAEKISEVLASAGRRIYGDNININLFTTRSSKENQKPTRKNIINTFKALEKASIDDVVFIFLSGHGHSSGSFEEYHYIFQDLGENRGTVEEMMGRMTEMINNPAKRKYCTLSLTDFEELASRIPAHKKALCIDTCFSGVFASRYSVPREIETELEISSQKKILEELREVSGFCILAGCSATGRSYEHAGFGHSFLTWSILRGIHSGEALARKYENEYLDVLSLLNYAQQTTERISRQFMEKESGSVLRQELIIQKPVVRIPTPLTGQILLGQVTDTEKKMCELPASQKYITSSMITPGSPVEDGKLKLSRMIDDAFRTLATKYPRYVFTENTNTPDAFRVVGNFRITGDKVDVHYWLKKGDVVVYEPKVPLSGMLTNSEKLIEKIVKTVKDKIAYSP